MIPFKLADWTLARVEDLANSGPHENDLYDFKGDLQGPNEQAKPLAAFANTRGGYLIFGVDKHNRVTGVDPHEFPKRFGDRVATKTEPSAPYEFGVAMPLANCKAVFVVHIPRSDRGPHAVHVDGFGLRFLKRTPSGSNEPMAYEEIRLAFQDQETKRRKLQLLDSEMNFIQHVAQRFLVEEAKDVGRHEIPILVFATRYPTESLISTLADPSSLLSENPTAWEQLSKLRDATHTANSIAQHMTAQMTSPTANSRNNELSLRTALRGYANFVLEHAGVCRGHIKNALNPYELPDAFIEKLVAAATDVVANYPGDLPFRKRSE